MLWLALTLLAGTVLGYFPKEDDYREAGSPQQQDFVGQEADVAGLVLPYREARPAVPARYDEPSLNFIKRGVMMGVDLPDFILNRNHAGNKHLQALRQRLFESGRRR